MLKKIPETSVEIIVHIIPGSSQEVIKGIYTNEKRQRVLKISVFAHPENNSANNSLIKFLSKYFSIPKTKILIKSGRSSRIKTIIIQDTDPERIRTIIQQLTSTS
jgi:uncharacterized protein (TIGR00251 family)